MSVVAAEGEHYARYFLVRDCQTVWRGDPAEPGSLFREFVITSNEFNRSLGTFQVIAIEGKSAGIKNGQLAPFDAEPTILFDSDFDGLDAASSQFKQLFADAEKCGFEVMTMAEILEFEAKLRASKGR